MGLGALNCSTNYGFDKIRPAPNPNPGRWNITKKVQYPNAYVLMVHYLDCTNFEGLKVMVYRGQFRDTKHLDPHFADSPDSPVARFRPDAFGWQWANTLARSL